MSVQRCFGTLSLILLAVSAIHCSSEVKIGAIISETGAVAPYGQQVRRGLDLALEEVNAAGGFKGGEIQLLYRDDGGSAERATAAVNELIDMEGVQLIIGGISSPVTLAIAPICQENEVLLMSPTSSAPKITNAGDYIFRNYPSDILEGTAMADFAKGMGVRRVVIFALDTDFGYGLEDVFTNAFEGRARKIVGTFRFAEGDDEALRAMVEDAKALEPQGIYIVAYVDEMVVLLKQLREARVNALLMATSSFTDQVAREAGEAAEKLVFPRPSFDVESSDPAVESFVLGFRAKYDQVPDVWAAHGYDALKVLWQAMLDTGYSRPDEVRRGLLGLKSYSGAAGRTAFDERGDVVRYPRLFVVQDGKPMPYEKFEQEGGTFPIPGDS